MNEQILVQKLREKDPEAVRYLYSKYHSRIFAVARRIVRDDWDAEEVTQDVFWTIYRKIHLFHDDKKLWNWVYRISANAAKMKVRKYKNYPIPLEPQDIQSISSDSDAAKVGDQPDEQLAYQETVERINAFLSTSDEVNRKVYVYMDLMGLTKEEAAERLDLSVSALKSRLHRVRYALREELAETSPATAAPAAA